MLFRKTRRPPKCIMIPRRMMRRKRRAMTIMISPRTPMLRKHITIPKKVKTRKILKPQKALTANIDPMTQQLSPQYLVSLGKEFGTPLYVYHAEKIKEQYHKLTTAFKRSNTVFFYACKALTNVNILKYICSLGANIDCSSVNEVKLALYAGFPPERILYTSNGISFDEIEEAQSLGVIINIDSLSNLE